MGSIRTRVAQTFGVRWLNTNLYYDDVAEQVIEAKVTPETQDVTPLWAITWRTRSATWMLRHRSEIERAL